MKTQAIIPAAGLGTRFKKKFPKSLFKIGGKPLVVHTLKAFEKTPEIDSVILVGHPQYLTQFSNMVLKFSLKKVAHIVAGGKTRTQSVGLGLQATDEDTDIVVIHDAARACVTPQVIGDAIRCCQRYHAAVVGVPVKSTIKRVRKGAIQETLKRDELWEIQTPQVFKRDILLKAYQHLKTSKRKVTDDASLVEDIGIPVKVCLGDYRNIKMTTPEDIALTEGYLKK